MKMNLFLPINGKRIVVLEWPHLYWQIVCCERMESSSEWCNCVGLWPSFVRFALTHCMSMYRAVVSQ
jgi:hypothetical protein